MSLELEEACMYYDLDEVKSIIKENKIKEIPLEALIVSADNNKYDIVGHLLEVGLQESKESKETINISNYLLLYSAEYNRIDITKYLLKKKIDFNNKKIKISITVSKAIATYGVSILKTPEDIINYIISMKFIINLGICNVEEKIPFEKKFNLLFRQGISSFYENIYEL